MRRFGATALMLAVVAAACDADESPAGPDFGPTPSTLSLDKIGGFTGGGVGAAEITAFDPASKRLFVINGALGTVDVLDLTVPSAPARVSTINVQQFGSGANSVAARDGIVALAIEAAVKTSPGKVAFYRASTLELLSSVQVGAMPDMITVFLSKRRTSKGTANAPASEAIPWAVP